MMLYHNEIDPPENAPEEMAPVALIPLCLLIIATSAAAARRRRTEVFWPVRREGVTRACEDECADNHSAPARVVSL